MSDLRDSRERLVTMQEWWHPAISEGLDSKALGEAGPP